MTEDQTFRAGYGVELYETVRFFFLLFFLRIDSRRFPCALQETQICGLPDGKPVSQIEWQL